MTLISSLGDQATRIRCLQGTALAIGEKGIAATTVQDILEAAGLSRRTFYQNFGSKEEALYALFEILTTMLRDAIRQATTAKDPVEHALQAADAYLTMWRGDPELSLLLLTESKRAGSPLAPLRRRLLETICNDGVNAYAQATGKSVDPLVYQSMNFALEGLLLRATESDDISYERIRAVFASIVRRLLSQDADTLPPPPDAQPK